MVKKNKNIKEVTEEIKMKVIEAYKKGKSLRQLEKDYGITRQSISGYLEGEGIKTTIGNHYRYFYHDFDFFEKIDTEEKAYWLGFMYADGYIVNYKSKGYGERSCGITLSIKDENHLKKFKTSIKATNPLNYYKKKNTNSEFVRLLLKSEKTVLDLINKGCVPQKTKILKFPSNETIPKNLLRHFIRGYFDGDGCLSYHIRKNKIFPKITFLGTMKFLNVLQNNLNKNIKTTILSDKRMKNTYILSISTTDVLDFLDYLYKDSSIYLDRKFNRYKIFKSCRSKQECLELLVGENGEDCDVNPVIIKDNNESLTL